MQGWDHYDKGEKVRVDLPLADADPDDFAALLLPGGLANPDPLRNAGADWVDEAVVVDRGLVTSRKPTDIPVLNERMLQVFAALSTGQGAAPHTRGAIG